MIRISRIKTRKPPSFNNTYPRIKSIPKSEKPVKTRSSPAYFTSAIITGGIGVASIYSFEKFKKEKLKAENTFKFWKIKNETKTSYGRYPIYEFWMKYKSEISIGLVCGIPALFYLKNSVTGFRLNRSSYSQLNAHGFINQLKKIETRRVKTSKSPIMNTCNTLRETFHRTFSHSGIIHFGLNTYLAFSLIDISLKNRNDTWDLRHTCAAIFGGLFSSSIAAKIGQLGLGFSGGVYAMLGYFYASESLNHLRFSVIFDINNEYPFGLSGFGSKWIPIETGLAILQALGMRFSPIGHIAHVSGFFYGVVVYYVFQEVYRPGYTKMVVVHKQEQLIEEINGLSK